MDIVVYRRRAPWAEPWEDAFIAGLAAHGLRAEERVSIEHRPCDLAVTWGHHAHMIYDEQRRAGGHYLVLERGYLGDRRAWCSVGLDGLHGRATVPPPGDDGARFDRHFGHLMQPWRAPGSGRCLVVMGQVPGDAALAGQDVNQWVRAAHLQLGHYGLPVYFRPHPNALARGHRIREAADGILPGTLADALGAAEAVATFSSTAAIDAVLAGVPAWTMDEGSMARPVGGCSLALMPPRPERRSWSAALAWRQWSPDEMRSGAAWAHLAPIAHARPRPARAGAV